jgi:predicted metalloenzyme YecM
MHQERTRMEQRQQRLIISRLEYEQKTVVFVEHALRFQEAAVERKRQDQLPEAGVLLTDSLVNEFLICLLSTNQSFFVHSFVASEIQRIPGAALRCCLPH